MVAKTQYTKEFREKVVEEYRKGNLTLEEVAAKYGIPAALLQDWVNKDDIGYIFASYTNRPIEKNTSIWSKVQANVGLAYQMIKVNGWLIAGCLPFSAMDLMGKCNLTTSKTNGAMSQRVKESIGNGLLRSISDGGVMGLSQSYLMLLKRKCCHSMSVISRISLLNPKVKCTTSWMLF